MLVCNWDYAFLNIFSNNVGSDLVYYSHIVPFVAVLVLGTYAFLANPKQQLNRLLFSITLLVCAWMLIDMVLWATESDPLIMFFWTLLMYPETLFYALFVYFLYVFIFQRDMPVFYQFAFFSPLLLPIFFAHTPLALNHFDLTNCDREAREGPLFQYLYLIEYFYIAVVAYMGFWAYRRAEANQKAQILYVSFGVFAFLAAFTSSNVFGSLSFNWELAQYVFFALPIFFGLLTYAVIQYTRLNPQLLGAQFLILLLILFVSAQFFFITSKTGLILIGATIVFVAFVGLLLVRILKQESQQQQQIQDFANKLFIANEELRKLDDSKSEFISIASHQLRTPLTAVKGFVSLILEGSYGKLENAQEDVFKKIFISTERLIRLVEDMLNISRIESGKMQFKISPVHLEPFLREMEPGFQLIAKDKGLSLTFALPAQPLPTVSVDPDKLREVVSNLIDNAMKYTNQGGVIVSAEAAALGAGIRILVKDTGIGVPKDEIPLLFNKFSRGKDTSRLRASGTGLGLYVGKQIVEAMGGSIWVESPGENQGSTFIIELKRG